MNRNYLNQLEKHLTEPAQSTGPSSSRPVPVVSRLKQFYALGCLARRRNLSITQAMQTPSIWNELKSSTDQEVTFFTAGLYDQEMPSLPVSTVPRAATPPVHPSPQPAPVAQLAAAPAPEKPEISSTNDLRNEVQLLKTLVGLLEQKLAQPVTIVNEFSSPKVISQDQTVMRDEEGNITKTRTMMNYET